MINLLNQEIQLKRQNDRKFQQLLIFFLILIVLALLVWGVIFWVEQSLNKQIATLNNQKSAVEANILKFRDLENNLTATNARFKEIDTLTGSRIVWSEILAALSSLTPTTIQIESLSVTAADPNTKGSLSQIQIAGNAKTLDDIEVYRKALDDSKTFGNSVFKSANLNREKNFFSFSLMTSILVNRPAKK